MLATETEIAVATVAHAVLVAIETAETVAVGATVSADVIDRVRVRVAVIRPATLTIADRQSRSPSSSHRQRSGVAATPSKAIRSLTSKHSACREIE